MRLESGTRLGKFEIVSAIGVGGMGEVYKAKDLELGREVVIKVLPQKMATRSSRLRRFQQEARAASALNHPNIVTIYEIGEHEGTPYIVMEYVAGRTLRQMLADGPLPHDKLIRYAAQMAEGLAKAHQAGIVHRDLKPENIVISDDGYVKIVDFGIAKLLPHGEARSALSAAGSDETIPGTMLGTIGYMSPEQVKGLEVDVRSDQFALGAVVYEMASGRRAFAGKSRSEVLSAIVTEIPMPLPERCPGAPEELCRVVHRCLDKDPAKRFASTQEIGESLTSLVHSLGVGAHPVSAELPRRFHRRVVLAGGAAAALVVVMAVLFVAGREPRRDAQLIEDAVDADPRADDVSDSYDAETPAAPLEPPNPVVPGRESRAAVGATSTSVAPQAPAPSTSTSVAPDEAAPSTSTSVAPERAPEQRAPNADDDEAAIREVMAAFERAIESMDIDLYRRIRPDITDQEVQRLRASFDAVDAHDVELGIDSIVIRGDSATVRATRTDRIVARGRSRDGNTRMQTFVLAKSGGRWIIVEMRQ